MRYKFRVATAPIPLQVTTYSVVGIIGQLTRLTDWWRAEQWLAPEGPFMTSARWQALLGFVFLTNFMVWVWLAFVKPPSYSRWNAFRFAREIYRTVLRGSPTELPEIADERARSARALVRHAWQKMKRRSPSEWPRVLKRSRADVLWPANARTVLSGAKNL